MYKSFIKKAGIITSYIARDLLVASVGDKIPSIAEYAQRFSSSRGVVQNSLALLEEEDCITLRKSGSKGTHLLSADAARLREYTGWDILSGTMPIPLNDTLAALTTAISDEMAALPVPCTFAYITSARNRLLSLQQRTYDFIVVSLSTAEIFLRECDFLNEPIVLEGCYYSLPYYLYFQSPTENTIRNGMRLAIDPACADQYDITMALCRGLDVSFVEMPYIGLPNALVNGTADCLVYRQSKSVDDRPWLLPHPISLPGFSYTQTVTPTILTHADNYGLEKILQKYLDVQNMQKTQTKVMQGEIMMRFY